MESKSNLHYNYVYFNANCNGFILNPDEYNAICTRDLESLDNVQVVQAPLQMSSCILRFLFNVHNDERISRRVCVPFKKIWYPLYFKDNFTNQKPLCFVFASSDYSFDYIHYLRKKYKNCKTVKIHRDLVKVAHCNPQYSEENMNREFDLRLTFDYEEAKKYHMVHFDEIESKVNVKIADNYPLTDVFFVGKAKDRLPKIIEAYDLFTSYGLKCEFYITHVKPEDQIKRDGIIYSNSFMPYKEMLYKSVNCRFMFDINQAGAVGYTSRFLEAVIYNKLLITDNVAVKHTKFYSSGNILFYENINDIKKDFFEKTPSDYNYNNEFSPIHLINLIDRELIR